MPFSPLGKGFLTGTVDATTQFSDGDVRAGIPRFTEENRAANQALVQLLGEVAAAKGATSAQVALAWLLAQQPWIAPIRGTRRLSRLEENVGSADLVLTEQDLAAIEAAASRIEIQGARYSEQMERMTGLWAAGRPRPRRNLTWRRRHPGPSAVTYRAGEGCMAHPEPAG